MTFRPGLIAAACAAAILALSACANPSRVAANLAAAAATALSPAPMAADQAAHPKLAWAIAGDWRRAQDAARDDARKPLATLQFFGLQPGMNVVELWPGEGYWTDIVGPFLAQTNGRYIAAHNDPVNGNPQQLAAREAFIARLNAAPDRFGAFQVTEFGPRAGAIAAPGSADMVMSMRGFHALPLFNFTDKALADIRTALKPGGLFVVEAHSNPTADTDGRQGYLPQAFVIQTVERAGFRLRAESAINANLNDTGDHPFGVWTLPPALRTAPFGQPPNPAFDQSKYIAIGESNRMTLVFEKI
jgi:predicted methyltransferase